MNAYKTGREGFPAASTHRNRAGGARSVLALAAAMLTVSGCGRGWVMGDSWRNAKTPVPFTLDEDKAIDFRVVLPEEQRAAQALLTDIEYLRLTSEQVGRFVGEDLPPPASGRPYLIRGVYLYRSGRFRVFHEGGFVVVHHANPGFSTAWRVKRRALVVWLDLPPTKIKPTVSIKA